jgi:hypothetical protein
MVGIEQRHKGTRVRVRDSAEKAHLRGLKGTIMDTYSSPGRRLAVHVCLDDGRWQLLWAEDLEKESDQ